MLILGIDTSSEIGALALVDDNGILGEVNLRLVHRHSEELLSNLEFLLAQTGKEINDLEGLSVTTGPGSFTGLRIGLTTAKSIAQVLEIPIVGVSSLDVLAYNLFITDGWLVPLIDARRNRVYTAIYQGWSADIKGQKISADKAVEISELIEELGSIDPEGVFYFSGNG